MVGNLASKKAGRELAGILGLLTIPIAVLWLFYFMEAKRDIDILEREKIGLQFAEILAPLFTNRINILTPGQIAEIPTLESKLEFAENEKLSSPSNRIDTINAGNADEKLELLVTTLRTIVNRSGLILDADKSSYHLISAGLATLPDWVSDYTELKEAIDSNIAAGPFRVETLQEILPLAGSVKEAAWRFGKEIESAVSSEPNKEILAGPTANSRELSAHVDEILVKLKQASSKVGHSALVSMFSEKSSQAKFLSRFDNLFDFTLRQVKTKIDKRLSTLWQRFILLTVAGFACAVGGVGKALFMFRKTLVHLDAAEDAVETSEKSRVELAAINDQVAALNASLAEKVKRLSEAQGELIKKGRMEQLGQLTATVAHELRNPLGSVRTSAFLLERKLAGKNLGVESQVDRINKGVVRCDAIITQLLDFSRTKSVAAQAAILDDWLATRVSEIAGTLPQSVQIECRLGLGNVNVPFDPARLERAVQNLLSNASEALVGDGKAGSAVNSQNPRIAISTFERGAFACIEVSDNGPGISLENIEKIREPLFTTKNFGTGLGVPAVEQIAAQHGGKLEIEFDPRERRCIPHAAAAANE